MCRYNSIVSASAPTYHERQWRKTMTYMKTNIPVNFQASLHAVCIFQHLRVYGMLGHSERSIPQSVWSPVICCWPKPGSTSIWGCEVQCGLGDLCLHTWWPHHAAIDPSHSGGTEPSEIPTCLLPHLEESSQLSWMDTSAFNPWCARSWNPSLSNQSMLIF